MSVYDDDEDSVNWIIYGGYDANNYNQLYLTSFYYTVTTISTVGYGDISGNNTLERLICIMLMIMGVFFFSFSSGSLTSIISNYDQYN